MSVGILPRGDHTLDRCVGWRRLTEWVCSSRPSPAPRPQLSPGRIILNWTSSRKTANPIWWNAEGLSGIMPPKCSLRTCVPPSAAGLCVFSLKKLIVDGLAITQPCFSPKSAKSNGLPEEGARVKFSQRRLGRGGKLAVLQRDFEKPSYCSYKKVHLRHALPMLSPATFSFLNTTLPLADYSPAMLAVLLLFRSWETPHSS